MYSTWNRPLLVVLMVLLFWSAVFFAYGWFESCENLRKINGQNRDLRKRLKTVQTELLQYHSKVCFFKNILQENNRKGK